MPIKKTCYTNSYTPLKLASSYPLRAVCVLVLNFYAAAGLKRAERKNHKS